jgi:predicted metal-binding membrane protein
MWVVMMAAMMLPSLVPMLWRYRTAVATTGNRGLNRLTALVGLGYLFVWTVLGMAVFPLGVGLAELEMDLPTVARAIPSAVAGVVAVRKRRFPWSAVSQLPAGIPSRLAPFTRRTPATGLH